MRSSGGIDLPRPGIVLGVTGSRHWKDRDLLFAWLDRFLEEQGPVRLVVHGGAEGADRMADEWAKSRGISTRAILPDYSRYPGGVAPLKRNSEIVETANKVVAFRAQGKSGGTDDCCAKARTAGKMYWPSPIRETYAKRPFPGKPRTVIE